MEDLELLKQHWNKTTRDFKSYTEKDLFKMIKGKSANIARNLFLLGCLEMLLWFAYEYFGDGNIPYIKLCLFFLLSVALIYQYFKVKNEDNSRELMRNILEIRWIILTYVILNIIFLVGDYLLNMVDYTQHFLAGYREGWSDLPLHSIKSSTLNPKLGDYIIFLIIFSFLLGVLLYIYHKVYGKLLKKLKINYAELSKAEENIY